MGDSNRVRWSYAEESTEGTAPAGAWQELRRRGGSLGRPQETRDNDEIRSDGQRNAPDRVGVSATGSLQARLSYGSYDDLLAACLRGDWSNADTNTGSLSVTAATGTFSMTGAFAEVVVGQWFKVEDASQSGNNGYHQVATRAGDDEVTVEDNTNLVDEGPTASVTIKVDGMLRNGTTDKSFSFAKEHLDLSPILAYEFVGMKIGGFELQVPAGDLMSLDFDLQGMDASDVTGGLSRASLDAANTNKILNGTAHVYDLREGSSALGDQLTNIRVASQNNPRFRRAIGSLAPVSVRHGTFDFNLTLELYVADGTLLSKYLDYTESSFSFRMTAGDGATYIITIPAYHYTGDLPEDGELNGDVVATLEAAAFVGSGGYSFQIDRFAA